MKNLLRQEADYVSMVAPYAVSAGNGALISGYFGVAQDDVANGAVGVFKTEGEFMLTCLSTDVPANGTVMYWDDTNKRVTTTSTSNTKIGVYSSTVTKLTGATTAQVRLNGVI